MIRNKDVHHPMKIITSEVEKEPSTNSSNDPKEKYTTLEDISNSTKNLGEKGSPF